MKFLMSLVIAASIFAGSIASATCLNASGGRLFDTSKVLTKKDSASSKEVRK